MNDREIGSSPKWNKASSDGKRARSEQGTYEMVDGTTAMRKSRNE